MTTGALLEISGSHDAPVVVVLGGISSSRHVAATANNPAPGWWNDFVGPGRPIDTLRFRSVSIDYIDAPDGAAPISTHDQASALAEALDDAGIGQLHAVVGASYGGMVALALAQLDPSRVERLIVISAAHQSSASATAHRSLQRRVVELGFRAGLEADALVIARGMAMTTYSTPTGLANRFDDDDPRERESAIEQFLALAGRSFAKRCSPQRFLSLSRSLDLHSVNPEEITTDTTLIGVLEDCLVPPSQLRDLARRLGGPCELELVSSPYGHDAFLEDQSLIAPIVARALEQLTGVPA
jgi:homoserine O-acetyltransferase/O-succinyltransferase